MVKFSVATRGREIKKSTERERVADGEKTRSSSHQERVGKKPPISAFCFQSLSTDAGQKERRQKKSLLPPPDIYLSFELRISTSACGTIYRVYLPLSFLLFKKSGASRCNLDYRSCSLFPFSLVRKNISSSSFVCYIRVTTTGRNCVYVRVKRVKMGEGD